MTKRNQTASSSGSPKAADTFESKLRGGDLDAFKKLVAKGVPRKHLCWVLHLIMRTSARPISEIVKGITVRRLLNVPNRIISFAEEIEQINSSPFLEDLIRTNDVYDFLIYLRRKSKYLDRIHEVFKNVPDWESNMDFSGDNFIRLPNLLRVYAILCLEPIVSNLRRACYKVSGQKYFTIWLLEFVKACTGQDFYPEVARLLNAVYRKAGVHKSDRDYYDAPKLSDLMSNNRPLAQVIREVPLLGKGLSPERVRKLRQGNCWPFP